MKQIKSKSLAGAQKIAEEKLKMLKQALEKTKWVCPHNVPGCTKNCGSYGCYN